MERKWIFYILSVLFFISIIGCRSAEITCRPSSAVGSPRGENGMITIAWDSTIDPTLAGYRVFYGTSLGKYTDCIDVGRITESSSNVIQYTLTGLIKGKKYYIAVIAYDTLDNRSEFSKEVTAVAK